MTTPVLTRPAAPAVGRAALPTSPAHPTPALSRRGWPRTALKASAGIGLTTALLIWALPRAVGASWSQIGAAVGGVQPWQLATLAALWLLGLSVHTVALSAALPGLSHRRSFLLNITGSFVSNLLPLGGAAGTVANYSMARSWGFGRVEFARWALLTNLWDTLVKLALPALAVGWLATTTSGNATLRAIAIIGVVALVAVAAGVTALLRSDRVAGRLGLVAGVLARRVRRSVQPAEWSSQAVQMRCDTAGLVSAGWLRMTAGKVAYAALQAVLLWACLAVVGLQVHPAVVFAAFAVQNVLTLLVLTPGASGFVEVGMAGVLVALGAPAAGAAAAILLYRGFVFVMEIPVGGALLAYWAAAQRVRVP